MRTDNHFITVSRGGVLMARRKGQAPVAIADAGGLQVAVDEEAVTQGAPRSVTVRFLHGGGNRMLLVTEVVVDREALGVSDFQARFCVSDEWLGAWVRRAIEAALDAASGRGNSCVPGGG